MEHKLNIRTAHAGDLRQVKELTQICFGGSAEGRLVRALNREGHSRLELVAELDAIIGYVLFSEITIVGKKQELKVLALAPLCVHPQYQKQRVGTALMREGIRQSQKLNYPAIFVVGDPEYYCRFGFSQEQALGFDCVYSGPALQALALVSGVLAKLSGKLVYSPPFQELT